MSYETALSALTNRIQTVFDGAVSTGAGGGAVINDAATATTTVWSSNKVNTELSAKLNAVDLATEITNQGITVGAGGSSSVGYFTENYFGGQ